jgi:DNA-binding response OmpR family regulator
MDDRPRVLSVDNNIANQKLVATVLAADVEVFSASSGAQALRMLESLRPDLILLDIDMPGMDGFQTCRSIRANPDFALTPIVFVSGLTERDEQLTAFQSGGDDFIAKPFDVDILRAKVSALILRYRRQQFVRNPDADSGSLDHLRRVNHYLLAVLKVGTLAKLNDVTLEALTALEIKAAIYIHRKPELLCSTCGSLTDLETQLLSQTTGAQMQTLGGRFMLGSAQTSWLIQNMPRSGSNEFTRLHDALVIMFDAYGQKVQTLLVKFAQNINPQFMGAAILPPDALMRYLVEIDDFTDDAISESLVQLQLVQKQTSGSLYERTQLAVLDTKLRRLQDEHAMRCREFKAVLGQLPLPASVLLDSA